MYRYFAVLLLFLTPAAAGPPVVTFNKDVAPIVFRYCAPCHRPGEAAPFSLLDYPGAKKHAGQIVSVTSSRYMPPWPPEPGKGDFTGSRHLTEPQLAVFRNWAAAGALEGTASDLPPRPVFTEGWQLGRPDLVLTLEKPYTLSASGSDVFRNFVLRVPGSMVRYVRALEIRPGNKRIVHHANVLVDRTGWARSRDGLDGTPGFEGMDVNLETQGFEPDSHFLFWKPGTAYSDEPPGMDWQLDPGSDLVLAMHLQPSGKPELLQPSIGLYFTDQPPRVRPMLVQLEDDGALDIPAGVRDFVVTDHLKLPVDWDVLAIYPHAHYLGHDLQATATLPDGTRRWLIHIADWDINWQAIYRYRVPVFLPKGTVISMRYTYDNSDGNSRNPNHPPKRVTGGDRSTDEMSHLWLQILPRSDGSGTDPRRLIQQAIMQRRLEKYPADFLAQYTSGALAEARGENRNAAALYRKALEVRPRDATAHNALGASLLAMGKGADAAAEFGAALETRPDYAPAHYNLARVLLLSGRFDEAIPHLRKVLAANADDAPALSNLGVALHMTGKTDEGLGYLQRAVEVKPGYFEGRYNLGLVLADKGDLNGAAAEFRAALKLKADDRDTHAALGGVLAEQKDWSGAERELSEALRLDPNNADLRKALADVKEKRAGAR